MGFKDEDLKAKYIQFEGLDMDPTGAPYGSSISAEKALSHNQYLLVAYEMNGKVPLTLETTNILKNHKVLFPQRYLGWFSL